MPVRTAGFQGMLQGTNSGPVLTIRWPANNLDLGSRSCEGGPAQRGQGTESKEGLEGQGWASLQAAANLSEGRAFLHVSLI